MSFTVTQSRPEHAAALAEIQRLSFPTLAENELMTLEHYLAHINVFPEGQHCVLDNTGKVVASSSDLCTTMDFGHIEHRYIDIAGNNWMTTHNPNGDWLYGLDIGVHPDFRGKGISELLYNARKNLARRMNLKGHVAGGMLKGYHAHKDSLSAEEYVQEVAAGKLFDPVLSIQLKRGFSVHGIIHNYVEDPSCANKAALIVWNNPDYQKNKPCHTPHTGLG